MIEKAFKFYVNANIHVAVAVLSLVCLTFYISNLNFDILIATFIFFATIASYNGIKYYEFILNRKPTNSFTKAISISSVLSLIICVIIFFECNFKTQMASVFFGIVTLLYAVPISENKTNLRNLAGIKIYIVSFCWVGVTLLLPLLTANVVLGTDFVIDFLQRFILILILILIFEINDLKYDDIKLRTVPQVLGVYKTKILIALLCIPFFIFEFLKANIHTNQWVVNLILIISILLLTYFATRNCSKYYTLFWVESIPIFWLFLSVLFK